MKPFQAPFGFAVLTLVSLPAAGHHSPVMFDMSRELVVEGTVTEVSWRNPHVYFGVEVDGPDGERIVQQIEAGPPSNFAPLGMDATSLRPGERVIVRVKPHRESTDRVALGWMLTKSDGTVIPLHVRAMQRSAPVTAEATSIAGTWVPQATGFSDLSYAAREWPLTDEGRMAVAETEAARVAARSECVPFGPPAIMALPVTAIIEVDDAQVRFKLDVMDVERAVHLDRADHPVDLAPSLHGHSIGRWEGNTLVVDTIGFTAHPEGYAFDLPSSTSKHIVERFTLSADRKHLEYEAVVRDPEYLAEPVTHRSLWDYRPEQKPSGLPCEPEAARRFATGE